MKLFTQLFLQIDASTKINDKLNALYHYFNLTNEADKLWTIAIFSGRNPKRIATTTLLKTWAAELADIPFWLFEETYRIVGDLSETISYVLPDYTNSTSHALHEWILQMKAMEKADEATRKDFITGAWKQFSKEERFVFNKLTSGSFRMGVATKLMVKALSKHTGLHENIIQHRLMGNWNPYEITYHQLLFASSDEDEAGRPYPFYLAYALDDEQLIADDTSRWLAEYKWDGIRCQLIKRKGNWYLWSRGEDLITEKFPDLSGIAKSLPDGTVIDGELVAYQNGKVLPFNDLQTRIGRKNLSAAILNQVPAAIFAYDLLEFEGQDYRNKPLIERRQQLERLVNTSEHHGFVLSKQINFNNMDELRMIREGARNVAAEGLMLKDVNSVYEVGRKKGMWWKWKLDPMSVDAVLIYAMRGSGRRANMYTDYTFGVWNEAGELVSFAKAYSGLTDKELLEVDAWIKQHTLDKFGPVRTVVPELVFEIGFEGINTSNRHKSGIAIRFPRILRWRKDKTAKEADTINHLKTLLK
ncbi:MAG: ATP-dependent DNA ligase [Bacteroidia bacterium]|jgi:DNA ligase-1|nr:ATP-dependent DNA ligase [Bacteroidia bacterium]